MDTKIDDYKNTLDSIYRILSDNAKADIMPLIALAINESESIGSITLSKFHQTMVTIIEDMYYELTQPKYIGTYTTRDNTISFDKTLVLDHDSFRTINMLLKRVVPRDAYVVMTLASGQDVILNQSLGSAYVMFNSEPIAVSSFSIILGKPLHSANIYQRILINADHIKMTRTIPISINNGKIRKGNLMFDNVMHLVKYLYQDNSNIHDILYYDGDYTILRSMMCKGSTLTGQYLQIKYGTKIVVIMNMDYYKPYSLYAKFVRQHYNHKEYPLYMLSSHDDEWLGRCFVPEVAKTCMTGSYDGLCTMIVQPYYRKALSSHLPYGTPTLKPVDRSYGKHNLDSVLQWFGFVRVTVLDYPEGILPYTYVYSQKRYSADHRRGMIVVITTVELKRMLCIGYKLFVHEYMEFQSSPFLRAMSQSSYQDVRDTYKYFTTWYDKSSIDHEGTRTMGRGELFFNKAVASFLTAYVRDYAYTPSRDVSLILYEKGDTMITTMNKSTVMDLIASKVLCSDTTVTECSSMPHSFL